MALSLYSGHCSSTAEANELFATEKGLLLLRPSGGCCCSYFFTIPTGCYALVTKHGADMDYESADGTRSTVWPEGLHFFYPPWIGVSYLVTKQSVVLDLPVKACKTKDNVTVNIDMALVFRIMGDEALGEDPELVRNFVYAVKPKGLEQQLRDAQEEAIRGCARSLKHTEIYGIRSGGKKTANRVDEMNNESNDEMNQDDSFRDEILEGKFDELDKAAALKATMKGHDIAEIMRLQLNRQFEPQGISIQSVMIKSVTLPEDITTQMSDKTMVISQNAAQRMTHENEMQNNRMEQKVETLMQTFQEQRDEERLDGAQRVNAEEVKLNDMKSQAHKVEANIRESTQNMIQSILADSALEVQRVEDNNTATVVQMQTEAEKEAAELLANTKLEVQTLLAESELIRAQNKAKAELLISIAEGKIAPWIEKKKLYETQMKQIEVFDSLAMNDKLILNGNADDDVNLIAVADSILAETANGSGIENNKGKMLAEMSIMKSGASAFMPQKESTMAK